MDRLVVATERDAAANERIAAAVEQQAAKPLNSSTSATPVVPAVQVDTATNLGPRGINSTTPGPEQLAVGNVRGPGVATAPAVHASVETRHGPKWARAVDIAKEAKRHGYDDVDYRDLLKVRPKLPDNGLTGKTKRKLSRKAAIKWIKSHCERLPSHDQPRTALKSPKDGSVGASARARPATASQNPFDRIACFLTTGGPATPYIISLSTELPEEQVLKCLGDKPKTFHDIGGGKWSIHIKP
jgi:hypothetical protein